MQRTIVLLTVVAVSVLLASGIVWAQSPPAPGDGERSNGAPATVSGIFGYITGGETLSGDRAHEVEYFVVGEDGDKTKLQIDDRAVIREALEAQGASQKQLNDGGPQPLVGELVTVRGRWTSGEVEGVRGSGDRVDVQQIAQKQQAGGEPTSKFDFGSNAALTGPKPAITIACKFSDNTAEPRPMSYFQSLVSGAAMPSVDHFWRETSYGQINLSGSQVTGWYTLPRTRAQYLNVDGSANLNLLAQDCTAQADAAVHFPSFSTINLMFNDNLDGAAWGGFAPLTRDGQTITYGLTWMPPWGYNNVGILGHEMGHSYGLPHSSGPYNQTYDSWWDVMSSGGLGNPAAIGRTDCHRDPTFGCMGMHTISAHKDKLNWIPAAQKYTAVAGSDTSLNIDRLGTATSTAGNYLMARIPINGSATQFYTVEARRPVGYDAHAAADGLVIHKIDTALSVGLATFARVVDPDNNNNPNDAGATWTAGETFTDPASSIAVSVVQATANGYSVRIQNGGANGPANDNLANAQEFTGTGLTGSNAGASKEAGEPNHANNVGGRSLWYRWTAPGSGPTTVTTSGSTFDTLLGVYTGSAVGSLTEVASNDDDATVGGVTSRVSFQATGGTTYRIAVDGFRSPLGGDAATGNVVLNLTPPATGGDTTAPSVSLTAPASGGLVRGTAVTLSADASDNVGVNRVQFLVDGAVEGIDTTAPYSVAWNSSALPDGPRTISARAFDAAGNSTLSSARQVIVDNLFPETVIDFGPPVKTRSTKATFRFSSPQADVIGFQCSIDGKAWTGCASPKTYTNLARKKHTFRVRAVGSAGALLDADTTPATRTWTIRR